MTASQKQLSPQSRITWVFMFELKNGFLHFLVCLQNNWFLCNDTISVRQAWTDWTFVFSGGLFWFEVALELSMELLQNV